LAPAMPWPWGAQWLSERRGEPLKPGQRAVPGYSTWGTMALATLDAKASACVDWKESEHLVEFIDEQFIDELNRVVRASEATTSLIAHETINAALAAPLSLKPGESKSVTFAIAWHFPNVQRFQHSGNYYSRRWRDATAVVDYLAKNLTALWDRTRQYHDTLYQSNLPEEFLDAMSSQSVILRGPTCWQSEEGYFGGFEGSYGCCPLNCTHVWNYAQTHARLFPTIGQNMRISNFITFLHPNGETSHREHAPHPAFIDGHCACIEAALREYQLSPDRRFLEQIWPGVKKAVNWLIGAIDPNHEGTPHGHQWNTYDTAVSGQNTFIGSQYLSALAAGVRMAEVMSDGESAKSWQQVLDSGRKKQNEELWNGEYFIQIPEQKPANDYNTGCHVDQLLGQWWAHMLGLGYLYPEKRVKSALAAVMKHNHRERFAGFKQAPRRYIPDDKGGLIICTWPRGGRPNPFILYADESWTGIEYSTAGAMVYEGLIDEARKIVRTARQRYDGRRLDGLDSGPGGNPFNELECGKFYARAMSSWSLLIASQGLLLEGPKGIIGFKPRWQPEDHRSFFTAPESWGMFVQTRKPGEQTSRIDVRYGKLRVRELVFELPAKVQVTATATAAGKPIAVSLRQDGAEARIVLKQEAIVPEAAVIEVRFRWTG
ncbi:MAG TPA: GH116 family glycosyl hydrolase, partial [Pirellulales bacterium]|nr:GH116 family glycosyl hydrolase [Pirellulales bacterium]